MNEISKQLILEYREGNERAFEKLVDLHLNPLYNFLYLIVRDKEAVEDIVQDTFLKAWKYLDRYDIKHKFRTWLYTIAKNTAFDYLKKKKALPFSSFEDDEGNNPLEESLGEELYLEEAIDTEKLVEKLEAGLSRISPLYRTLLTLIYKEDFSLQEAAEILKIPYNTLKSQHRRGIVKLREALDEHGGNASKEKESRTT